MAAPGYIYIRDHPAYNGLVKVGKTQNIPEREQTYITSEYTRGKFIHVWEICLTALNIIDRLIKFKFQYLNRYNGAGTEFYEREVINEIPVLFESTALIWRELSAEEIENLLRPDRVRAKWKRAMSAVLVVHRRITPRPYQVDIIQETVDLLQTHERVLLNLACGVGKTLISLWVFLRLFSCNGSVVIGVPNLILLAQWRQRAKNMGINAKVTTYQSAHKLLAGASADMLICDEVHHLGRYFGMSAVDDLTERQFGSILNIKTKYVLGLSATPPADVSYNSSPIATLSRSTIWAIDNNIICDYVINCIFLPGECVSIGDELQYAAKAAIWCLINEDTPYKMLIYANSRASAEKLRGLINAYDLTSAAGGATVAVYDSTMSRAERAAAMGTFIGAQKAALVCVYCLGEGWDFPELDAVLFAENMTSEVRIVQAALRAARKNPKKPDKVAKIIIPLLGDFKQIAEVVRQIGAEDANLAAKIRAYTVPTYGANMGAEMFTFDDKITNLLRVYSLTRLEYIRGEIGELTYNKAKHIIAKYFKCQFTKPSEYIAAIQKYNLELPTDPELYFIDFISWDDYLGTETGNGHYTRGEIFDAMRRSLRAGVIGRLL